MPSEKDVAERLQQLKPHHLEVVDESDGCGAKFLIVIVSDEFEEKRLLQCHRLVQEAISDIMPTIHAVTIKAFTKSKWNAEKDEKVV